MRIMSQRESKMIKGHFYSQKFHKKMQMNKLSYILLPSCSFISKKTIFFKQAPCFQYFFKGFFIYGIVWINISYFMLSNIIKRVALFSTEVQKSNSKATSSSSTITQYKEGQLVNRTAIILKKQQDIESYVIKTVQNYFRTTYKNGVTKSSSLAEHGLDSLDAIEIAMQIEQDLGYTISAETLPSFNKVSHYITYIEHVQAFKRENNKAPIS